MDVLNPHSLQLARVNTQQIEDRGGNLLIGGRRRDRLRLDAGQRDEERRVHIILIEATVLR